MSGIGIASLPDMNLSIEYLRSGTAFEQIKAVWETLERKDPQCSPFLSWAWQSAWWQRFGRDHGRLRLLIVRDGQQVVAISPMFINTAAMLGLPTVNTLAFTGDVQGLCVNHEGMICLPRYRSLAIQTLLNHLPTLKGWKKICLNGLLTHSEFAWAAKKSSGLSLDRNNAKQTMYAKQQSLPSSWAAFRNDREGLLGDLLSTTSVELRKLGGFELSICSSLRELERGLLIYQNMVDEGKSLSASRANVESASFAFVAEQIKEFFIKDQLWQISLIVDDQVLCIQHYLLWRSDLILIQSGVAPEYEHLDIEKFVLAYAVKRGIEHVIGRMVVLLRQADNYQDYVTESLSVSNWQYSPSKLRRWLNPVLRPFRFGKSR